MCSHRVLPRYSPVQAWASLTACIQSSPHWPPSKTACAGEQAVLCTASASQAPVEAPISREIWKDTWSVVHVKGGWGLLAGFEAPTVLDFRDKTPTLQEGE